MSRLLRRLAISPRGVLRLQLAMICLALLAGVAAILYGTEAIGDRSGSAALQSRQVTLAAHGETLLGDMLAVLDEARAAYMTSDAFATLDRAAQDAVHEELFPPDGEAQ